MTVKDIFEITHNDTNFVLQRYNSTYDGYIDTWVGTQLHKCEYRNAEVKFMRVVGCPYEKDGYIELRIDV